MFLHVPGKQCWWNHPHPGHLVSRIFVHFLSSYKWPGLELKALGRQKSNVVKYRHQPSDLRVFFPVLTG